MATKHFYSTSTDLSAVATAPALVRWIETFVQILFPESGVEYWSVYDSRPGSFGPSEPIPDQFSHVAVYVRQGNSEGRIIDMAFVQRNGTVHWLGFAKTFGSEDECWTIAQAVSAALDCIIIHRAVPMLVALDGLLPMKHPNPRRPGTRYTGKFTLIISSERICLVTGDHGLIFEWASDQNGANYLIAEMESDWTTVLNAAKANWEKVSVRKYRVEASNSDPRTREGYERGNLADYSITDDASKVEQLARQYLSRDKWVEVYEDASNVLLAGPLSPFSPAPAAIL